jgi:hypothetical protein
MAAKFPHSEISGSKVAMHLPEAYRSYATSFIAPSKSRHPPCALSFPLGKLKTTIAFTGIPLAREKTQKGISGGGHRFFKKAILSTVISSGTEEKA